MTDSSWSKTPKERRWPPPETAGTPWHGRWSASVRLRGAPSHHGRVGLRCERAIAGAVRRWRANSRSGLRTGRGETWSGDPRGAPFRVISDDDLLRFFAVCETAGMLG